MSILNISRNLPKKTKIFFAKDCIINDYEMETALRKGKGQLTRTRIGLIIFRNYLWRKTFAKLKPKKKIRVILKVIFHLPLMPFFIINWTFFFFS